MTILVTGAAGFIGFHVSTALLRRGERVIGVDNLNDYYDVALKEARLAELRRLPGFAFHRLELAERGALAALLDRHADTDRVVHLAAQAGVRYSLTNPHSYIGANAQGQLEVLEACRSLPRLKHLVFASSSSVYGPWGRPDMAAWIFTEAILAGRPIQVFNHGDMRRDFTFIDDIVSGVVACLDRPPADSGGEPPYRLYNIGNHRSEELKRFIAVLERALGRKAIVELAPMQPGDVPATYADIAETQRDLGFAPTTPIDQGLPRFVAWYRAYHRL